MFAHTWNVKMRIALDQRVLKLEIKYLNIYNIMILFSFIRLS